MSPQKLQQKLPEIQAWIQRTLALHRPNSRPVASLGFPRLGSFYPAQMLASTRVVEAVRLPVPPLTSMGLTEFSDFERGSYNGMTYLDTYFVRPSEAARESLHFHELVHVVQWQQLGPERFLLAYALGYLLGGGYQGNPLEIMAFELQAQFDQGGSPFDALAEVRRRLDSIVPALLGRLSSGSL